MRGGRKKKLPLTILLLTVPFMMSVMYFTLSNDVYARKNGGKYAGRTLILYWGPREYYREQVNSFSCFKKCEVTNDKSRISEAEAVVFDAQKLKKLPPRKTGQVWVFNTMESPDYCTNDMTSWNRAFNWTWTHRRDSDLVNSYGEFSPRKFQTLDMDFSEISKRKSRSVLWIVSNCKTKSKREAYIDRLRQSSYVDILGGCGKTVCSKYDPECRPRLLNGTYRFYLSFENSNCRDYITEKIYNVMTFDILPIVRGGYNASIFMPEGSYIDANDFKVTSYLSYYLHSLAQNKKEYEKFFTWRNRYKLGNESPDHWCILCDRLHNQQKYRRVYKDINSWWRGNEEASWKMCQSNAVMTTLSTEFLIFTVLHTALILIYLLLH